MDKCKYCYLRDAKPCYECNMCRGGDDHFRPAPALPKDDRAPINHAEVDAGKE